MRWGNCFILCSAPYPDSDGVRGAIFFVRFWGLFASRVLVAVYLMEQGIG
jgi:hypothetical protein